MRRVKYILDRRTFVKRCLQLFASIGIEANQITTPKFDRKAVKLNDIQNCFSPYKGNPSDISSANYAQYIEEAVQQPTYEAAWLVEAEHTDINGNPDRGDRVRGSRAVLYESFLYKHYQRLYGITGNQVYEQQALQSAERALKFAGWWFRGMVQESSTLPIPPKQISLAFISAFSEACQFVWWGYFWLQGAAQQTEVGKLIREISELCLSRYEPYRERGANNRAFYAAIWYEIALNVGACNQDLERAQAFRSYAGAVWEDWFPFREHEEDDSHYGMSDLTSLYTWLALRGVDIAADMGLTSFWIQNAEQIMNDGMWPSYGSGPIAPVDGLVRALFIAEVSARATQDGKYKTLAHRSFWLFQNRLSELKVWSNFGYEEIFLMFAYVSADDQIGEVPLITGITLTQRRKIRRADDWSGAPVRFFHFEEGMIDSKVIIRCGSHTDDLCLFIQARDQGGHGRPDVPSILFMEQGHSFLLYNGVARLDAGMRFHNILNIQDPKHPELDNTWARASYARTQVSTRGQTSQIAYVRIEVMEAEGYPATYERWDAIRTGNVPDYGYPQAIGYNNYPAREERSIMVIHNRFVFVKDTVRFTLDGLTFRIGPNWVTQQIDTRRGDNWVNTWIDALHYDHSSEGMLQTPMCNAPRHLMIWFPPSNDATLSLEDLNANRPVPTDPIKMQIDTGQRIWQYREGTWAQNDPQAFVTLLWPHDPDMDPHLLVESIQTQEDTPLCSIIRIAGANGREEFLWINRSGQVRTIANVETDAESGYLSWQHGQLMQVSCIKATVVRLDGHSVMIDPENGNFEFPSSSVRYSNYLPLVIS